MGLAVKKIRMVLANASKLGDTGDRLATLLPMSAANGRSSEIRGTLWTSLPSTRPDYPETRWIPVTESSSGSPKIETAQARTYKTVRIEVVDPDQYEAINLVSGHGTMWNFPDFEG